MQTDILLESGTNELEIMEFTIAGVSFGINVAKITEIMQYRSMRTMPNSHPCIEGVFQPRDTIITVFNLIKYMGFPESENLNRDMFIITGFNNLHVAFHVHMVEGIHRIKWSDIERPDSITYGGDDSISTGIAKINKKLITIIDFEKIVSDISPQTGIQLSEIDALGPRERNSKPVVTADDSVLLRKMIYKALNTAGYTNIKSFSDGQQIWDYLASMRDEAINNNVPIETKVAAVISDIEMPMMDGHHLTKLIKEDKILKKLPVILFSSLIDDAMQVKGRELGANAQLSKPEIGNLVTILDKHIL
ncbi:MAG: chemotaxis protein [Oscillospiraceae bacterium]|nr:chemotaxis protein [Oscillospiraceae bacterium]